MTRTFSISSVSLSPRKAAIAALLGAILTLSAVLWNHRGWEIQGAALAFVLAWAALIDIDRMALPDVLTLGLIVTGFSLHLPDGIDAIVPYLIGATVGYAAFAAVAAAYRKFRGRDGIGGGDAKLFAAGGAWLGWEALPIVLLAASITALLYVLATVMLKRSWIEVEQRIPFGPFLATGIWIAWLYPPAAM